MSTTPTFVYDSNFPNEEMVVEADATIERVVYKPGMELAARRSAVAARKRRLTVDCEIPEGSASTASPTGFANGSAGDRRQR